jgi:UDP-N-acetylmuramate: L-alanyl-gamma-D-glutamyl-meso-diaminopimelate ligase
MEVKRFPTQWPLTRRNVWRASDEAMKVHLIGICGTGMGSLAGLLKAAGHDVRGSDEHVYPPMSVQLRIRRSPASRASARPTSTGAPDAVVVGNVCRKDHVEVLAAQERGIPLESFPSLFSKLFLQDEKNPRRSVVVAGTHGKTTDVVAARARAAGRRSATRRS